MTCSNCAATVTKALQKKGLRDVTVSFIDKEVSFLLDEANTISDISSSIHKLGYKVVTPKQQLLNVKGLSLLEKKFYFSLLLTLPLFFSMWLPFHWLHAPITQLLLCIPVFFVGLWHFGKSAWGSVKMGVPNMDVLILIGSSAAFIYSLMGMIVYSGTPEIHTYLFFETTATIITLVLLGNLIEDKSVSQTGSAVRELAAMKASKALLVSMHEGHEHLSEVDSSTLLKFDLIHVNTGDKVPVDGMIISGNAALDESLLTGESMPIEKGPGAQVIGGTIVVNGQLRIRATKVGSETVLAGIIELVKKAQNEKPAIQKLGDKVSAIFVPVVLGISLLTFLLSYFGFEITMQTALMHSIAVLVISCPCAMGLATPTAVMAGIGRAAKNRILIRGGNTLEQFAQIKTIVFDKTGTLTTGNFILNDLIKLADVDESTLRNLIFSLELNSSHPIAKSLVNQLKGKAQKIELHSIQEEKGLGISASDTSGNSYFIGHNRNNHISSNHNSSLILTKNNQLIASLNIKDEVKISARECISTLKKLGIKTILLSGDADAKCKDLALQVGIDEVYSEQSPAQKLVCIEKLKASGAVAMVGDGVNDAPALSKADVGISLSNATGVAIESSQIILLNGNNLNDIALAFQLSKTTLKTIKQNLFWAFFYNTIAIPIAALGFLNPMLAALSMAFSDVIVIGNSIWLKTKKLN
ncbi:MAG: cadmium-translocating P-type ATPase [Bacteroidetes bacterium]|nr:cadmium-translocating P-type ATPase [Bacteroidota bacterium]